MLVGFFGQAVGTASFPYMARLAAENRLPEMNRLLNTTLKYLAVVVPFSVLVMVLRNEAVMLLFQRGRFDAAATALTARLLLFLMAGTVAFSAQSVIVRAYFAVRNTLFPSVFCSAGALLSIPLYWYNMRLWGAGGIAAAISISVIFQAWLLYALWNRRGKNAESAGVYRHYLKVAAISAGIGAGLKGFRLWLAAGIDTRSPMGAFMVSALVGLAFLGLLFGAGRLFRIREVDDILVKILGRVRTGLTRILPFLCASTKKTEKSRERHAAPAFFPPGLLFRPFEHDPGIGHDAPVALRVDDERIDVQFVRSPDGWRPGPESRRMESLRRLDVRGRLSADSLEHPVGPDGRIMFSALMLPHGGQPEGDILQDLHEDPSQAEHADRAERGSRVEPRITRPPRGPSPGPAPH